MLSKKLAWQGKHTFILENSGYQESMPLKWYHRTLGDDFLPALGF